MKRILIALALFSGAVSALAQDGFLAVHGNGAPSTQTPVPDCTKHRLYNDDLTGTLWSSSRQSAYPCGWVQNTSSGGGLPSGTGIVQTTGGAGSVASSAQIVAGINNSPSTKIVSSAVAPAGSPTSPWTAYLNGLATGINEHPFFPLGGILASVGDSENTGYGNPNPATQNWFYYLCQMAPFAGNVTCNNQNVNGNTLAETIVTYANTLHAISPAVTGNGLPGTLVLSVYTDDAANICASSCTYTQASYITAYINFVQNTLLADGWKVVYQAPFETSGDGQYDTNRLALNQAIKALAQSLATSSLPSPVAYLDLSDIMNTPTNTAVYNATAVHPNPLGSYMIAQRAATVFLGVAPTSISYESPTQALQMRADNANDVAAKFGNTNPLGIAGIAAQDSGGTTRVQLGYTPTGSSGPHPGSSWAQLGLGIGTNVYLDNGTTTFLTADSSGFVTISKLINHSSGFGVVVEGALTSNSSDVVFENSSGTLAARIGYGNSAASYHPGAGYWNCSISVTTPCYIDYNSINAATITAGLTPAFNFVNTPTGTVTTTATAGGTPAILGTNQYQSYTLSAAAVPTIAGIAAGQRITLQVCQPSTGGPYAWTWPTAFKNPATITTTAGMCTQQTFESFNGTDYTPDGPGMNVNP